MQLKRQDIVQHLKFKLPGYDLISAAWEGGSTARQRADELSDIDLVIVCDDQEVEQAFLIVEKELVALGGIDSRFRIPEPTWHGHSQCFYQLTGAEKTNLVDCVVIKKSSSQKFLEKERHGEPVVYVDRIGVVRPASIDKDDHQKKIAERTASLKASFHMFQPFILKELDRGRFIDAMAFYQSLTMKPLVDALGIRYRPDRFDFGLRYIHDECPASVAAQVQNLVFVNSPEELRDKHRSAVALFDQVIAEL